MRSSLAPLLATCVLVGYPLLSTQAQISSMDTERHAVIGARSASMADTYVSDAYDVSCMYSNPAAISLLRNSRFSVSGAMEIVENGGTLATINAAFPYRFSRTWSSAIGVTVHQIGTRFDHPATTIPWFQQSAFDLAVSNLLGRGFSMGAVLTVHSGRIDSSPRVWGVSGALGAYYSPNRGISYGISFQGLGEGVSHPLDNPMNADVAALTPRDRSLQAGLTMRYPYQLEEPYVTISIANQKVFSHSGLVYKGAVEWLPQHYLALRVGYWVGPHSVSARFGIGIRLLDSCLDYAIAPGRSEPRFHQLSLSSGF